MRNAKKCFRELYRSLFEPEQFSVVLRNAHLAFFYVFGVFGMRGWRWGGKKNYVPMQLQTFGIVFDYMKSYLRYYLIILVMFNCPQDEQTGSVLDPSSTNPYHMSIEEYFNPTPEANTRG